MAPQLTDPKVGQEPALRLERASAALTPQKFERIKPGYTADDIDRLLGKGRDEPSPAAFYRQAAAVEIESEFGVKRWREWSTSAAGVTVTVGFDSDGKAAVKQFDDGAKVRFAGWKSGREVVRLAR